MLKDGQTYFKNVEVLTPQNVQSMFDHFSTSCIKMLNVDMIQGYLGKTREQLKIKPYV